MTRFLPAIFLLLLASRACGSTVNLTWSYDYTGRAGLQRHGHEKLHGPLRDARRDQRNAGAHRGGAESR